MLKTLVELSELYGIPRRDINELITEGKLVAQKQERARRGLFQGFRYLLEEKELEKYLQNRKQENQKELTILKTTKELSELYGVKNRKIRYWISLGRITAQEEKLPGNSGWGKGFRYLIDEDEFKEYLKVHHQETQMEMPEQETKQGTGMKWVIENANRILSFFLACNDKQGTTKYFGLNVWTLSVAFHIAGRDDLMYPSFCEAIKRSYPSDVELALQELAKPAEVKLGLLSPLMVQPSSDNFHANLIAFFKEVEENDKKLIELQEQSASLTSRYNDSQEEVTKLRSIIVQAKEMMARGD